MTWTPRSVLSPIAIILTVAACGSTTEPNDATGSISGTVNVIGSAPVGAQPEMLIHVSVEDLDLRRNARAVALAGTQPTLTFRADSLPEGTYYLNACVTYGCRFHGQGTPAPVMVRRGQVTTINMDL